MWRGNWKINSLIVIALATCAAAIVRYRGHYLLEEGLGCVATWLNGAITSHKGQIGENRS